MFLFFCVSFTFFSIIMSSLWIVKKGTMRLFSFLALLLSVILEGAKRQADNERALPIYEGKSLRGWLPKIKLP